MSQITDQIEDMASKGMRKSQIAQELGVSLRYVQQCTAGKFEPDLRGSSHPSTIDDEVLYLRNEVGRLQREVDERRRDTGSVKSFFREAIEHMGRVKAEPPAYHPPKVKPGSVRINSPVVAVAQWCDWHMGKVQRPDEIEGFGEFSPDLAKIRMASYARAFQKWVEAHRSVYTVNELHILVLGDLISGMIHDELMVTAAFPVPVQVVEAARLLSWSIAQLSPHYATTVVHFIVEDNHSRLTRKPQSSQAGINSFNYLVGMFSRERLLDVPNLLFNIYPQFQRTVEVGGRHYLLSHGHKVQGWAGFPYYGLERRAHREAMKRMVTGIGKFDRVVIGHWHAPLCHPYYWIGGSLSGTDAYDHSAGRHAAPSQAAWMVHPRHGEFDRTDFDLK